MSVVTGKNKLLGGGIKFSDSFKCEVTTGGGFINHVQFQFHSSSHPLK